MSGAAASGGAAQTGQPIEDCDLLILNGPNLNMLGLRQPEVYGGGDLSGLDTACVAHAQKAGLRAVCRQTNWEGAFIDWIHQSRDRAQGLIVNAGAWTHTSIAVADALAAAERPVIEVHLSNIHAREPFRHKSHISPLAVGVICGLGVQGYLAAIDAFAARFSAR